MNTIRRLTQTLLVASCILLLAGCASDGGAPPDSRSMQNAQQDIQDLHSQFLKAFNSKDANGLAAVFTQDGVLMPADAPETKTQLAIQEYYRQMLANAPITGILRNVAETTVTGDYAFCSGYYTL